MNDIYVAKDDMTPSIEPLVSITNKKFEELVSAKTTLETICKIMQHESIGDEKVLSILYEICDYGHLFE